ncbi:MAG: ParB/RepB/Spo0J family partition protein [Parvibaculales bacterium]
MSEKKRGLGRGLSALIGDNPVSPQPAQAVGAPPATGLSQRDVANSDAANGEAPAANGQAAPTMLGIALLQPGKFQPRRHFDADELAGLAESFKKSGILQPLLVRPLSDGQYEIIAGERRWRAAQQAQLHNVPVLIRDLSDSEALEIGIVENVQRADLNPVEEAEGYQRLIDEFAYTQADLAEIIGKSRSHIANTLRLAGASAKIRDYLISGALSAGHARAILAHKESEKLAEIIVKQGLSVRQAEKLAAGKASGENTDTGSKTPKMGEKDADTRALEKTLADALGLNVQIDDKGGDKGGAVRIDYRSLEQLDGLVAVLLARS